MTYLHLDLDTGGQYTEPAVGWGGPLQALAALRRALPSATGPHDHRLPVALVTSTVGGLGAVGTARCAAVGVSPLSGAVAETRAEGPYAAGMRAAGITGIGLSGRAEQPSYVVVEAGRATVHPAGELWGTDTRQATAALAERHGPGAAVAVIGPAGEAGNRYASVLTCGAFPLPRLGFGAVLGARHVKAVVCVPSGAAPWPYDVLAAQALFTAYRREMPGHPLAGRQHAVPGFGSWPGTADQPGTAAVRNFADTATAPASWPGLHPDRYTPLLTRSGGGCPGCPNDCVKEYAGAGLHQEAVAMLGPNLGIGDLAAILDANARCQDLGLDPVSLGGTLACVFEAAERGPLPAWLADRLPEGIGFGASGLLAELAGLAATPDHPLGLGAAELAARLGAPELAMTGCGVELPPFDPRVQPGLGLMYAAAPTGPRYDVIEHDLDFDPVHGLPHCFDEAERLGLSVPAPASTLDVARTLLLADLWSGLDALLICPYASTPTRPLTADRVCELVRATSGRPVTVAQLLSLGRERLRAQQALNDLLGVAPGTLPDRFFAEPVAAGPHRGAVLDRVAFGVAVQVLRRQWA
ncbi:aldehyde ferredoxin oxidoreductase C-terminal domain-containing protein [Catellatospora bangladeshensis]|uniref:Aldehyde ferredoxin oxidoreductase n=1 Tax=Catellatospora bangladeshensis TaxID=310355 RepID=A0A8J3JUB7_9ACTN|nr:aldehyde ferredoxin oxidoreductase C-terminal domain-containing protein [Catellatospora bangladeshensis]GIF83304.1 aldehyde ferredoxin oxidoreductase [Catellatospora bangladeshensis]